MNPNNWVQGIINQMQGNSGQQQTLDPSIVSPIPKKDFQDNADPALQNYYQREQSSQDQPTQKPVQMAQITPTPTASFGQIVVPTRQPTPTPQQQLIAKIKDYVQKNIPMQGKGMVQADWPIMQGPGATQQQSSYNFPIPQWQEFVKSAQKIAKQEGFPLSVLLGQSAVETGRNSNNAPGNNWFGIKGSGSAGTQNLATKEATPQGQYYNTNSNFAAYNNAEDSIKHYISLIKSWPDVWALRSNPVQMIQAIKAHNYATSPSYAQNVMNTPEFRQYLNQ